MKANRRKFIMQSLTAAGLAAIPGEILSTPHHERRPAESFEGVKKSKPLASIRFSVIGLNHGHINGQTDSVIRGGEQLISVYAKEKDLADSFAKRFPQAKLASSEKEILDDPSIQLVVSASIPVERAPLGIQVMK